jgi:uncharacterized membrane protein YfcA
LPEVVWLGCIAFLAGLIHGLTGFGAMLVGLPLMVLLMDIKAAVPLILLLGMVINIILVIQLRRHMDAGKVMPLLLSALPGVPIGAWCLKTIAPHWLELLVGIVVLATAAATWHRITPKGARELKMRWVWMAGFSAGVLGGSIGAPGPPVIIFTSLQPWAKHQIKSIMVAFFTLVCVGIAGVYLFLGLITREVLRDFGYCALPLVFGILIGISMFNRIGDAGYRQTVYFLLVALGIMMLIRGAGGL